MAVTGGKLDNEPRKLPMCENACLIILVLVVPEPRKDHAVVMCRFARDCMDKLKPLLKKLEVVLGPDTGDLSMRFGLHSGPGKRPISWIPNP